MNRKQLLTLLERLEALDETHDVLARDAQPAFHFPSDPGQAGAGQLDDEQIQRCVLTWHVEAGARVEGLRPRAHAHGPKHQLDLVVHSHKSRALRVGLKLLDQAQQPEVRFREVDDQARPDVVAVLIFPQHVRFAAAILLSRLDQPARINPDYYGKLIHAAEPPRGALLHQPRIVLRPAV